MLAFEGWRIKVFTGFLYGLFRQPIHGGKTHIPNHVQAKRDWYRAECDSEWTVASFALPSPTAEIE
jgi:hypothetical protein